MVIWIALSYYTLSIVNYVWLRALGYPADYVRGSVLRKYYGD